MKARLKISWQAQHERNDHVEYRLRAHMGGAYLYSMRSDLWSGGAALNSLTYAAMSGCFLGGIKKE